MYAIIETGGKQYRVSTGDVVNLEFLKGDVGQTITFDKVLLVGGNSNTQVGTPYVTKASLQGEIVAQSKGDKILTIKYKRRKGYRRTIGHRQLLTRILVTKIEDGQGQSISFDSAKRTDVLKAVSIATSAPKAASKKAAAPKTAKAKTTKAASAKKAKA